MDSISLYTGEIDDLDEAVAELFEGAEGFELKANTLGIIFTEDEADYPELYARLATKWDFPIIGCTTMAMLHEVEGYCGNGIGVLLLTDDHCKFAAGVTESLDVDNYKEEITRVYEDLAEQLDNEEKLIISYGVLVTDETSVAADNLVNALDAVGNHVPICGGLASDAFNFVKSRVFYNDRVVECGLVFALVSGDIHPQYISVNSIENRADFAYEITKSDVNVVYKLGDGTFLDALEKESLAAEKTEVLADYLLSPFVVSIKQPDGEYVEAARNLSILDHVEGSGTFLGIMPEGSILSVGIINRDDVQTSVEKVFEVLKKKLDASPYEYHTILCTTCAARFLALASNITAEADICIKHLPEGFSMLGMHGYGEFCPVVGKKSGEEYNMFHNFTFTVLVL